MELKGLAKVPWDSVFARFLLEKKYGNVRALHTSFYWIKDICRSIIYPSILFDKDISGSSVLFLNSFIGRSSIVDNFLKVRGLVRSDLVIKSCKKNRIDWRNCIRLLFLSLSWNSTLKCYHLDRVDRFSMVSETLRIVRLHDELLKLPMSGYNLIVTFNDSFTLESYAVEYCRLFGVKSASLQHGQFVSWRADTFFDCGIEFRTFKSDYFLIWNRYTYDEAIKFGIEPDKLVITGIWSYIGTKREICKQNMNGVFGVVLSHPSWSEENTVLIEAANILSTKYGLNYYLKLHPNYPDNAYDSLVNDHYLGLIPKGINVMDYANRVDFSLVGSSSLFAELVFIGHRVYRYSSRKANDKYSEVKVGNFFNSPSQLPPLFAAGNTNTDSDALFDYLCTVPDVSVAYKAFFEQFIG